MPPVGIFGLGPWEIGIILLVALLLFGSRLPEVARSIGKSITSFRHGVREAEDEVRAGLEEGQSPPADDAPKTAESDTASDRNGDAA